MIVCEEKKLLIEMCPVDLIIKLKLKSACWLKIIQIMKRGLKCCNFDAFGQTA